MSATRAVLFGLVAVLLLATSAASAKTAKSASKLAGKVFVTADRVMDRAPEALARQFQSAPAQAVLGRKTNGHWIGTAVAFFKKPSVAGPIIIWIFDKADKQSLKDNEPVQALNVEGSPQEAFSHEIDFDPDQGYNKDHVYLVRVGQIIAKKPKVYASGEVKLLK